MKPHFDYTVPQKAQSWPSSQYQDTALTVWLLKTESEYFSKCDTKARTQEELAKPATAARAAAAEAHFTHRRPKSLETEGDLGKQGRSARWLETHVDTHLSDKEVSTNGLWKNEAVKEELTDTNTKAIERIKIGSFKVVFAKIWRRRKWCLAKNPAKLFSRWVIRHPWLNAHTTF